jgi:hypothetical protein
LRAIILTRDKKATIKNVDSKRSDYEFRKAVYILDPNRVQNFQDPNGEITGQELIFFEENPNPLSHEDEPEDLSSQYLDDVVIINFIQQTTDTFGKWNMPSFGFLTWFIETPSRIPFVLMAGLVAWTLIKNYLAGGAI